MVDIFCENPRSENDICVYIHSPFVRLLKSAAYPTLIEKWNVPLLKLGTLTKLILVEEV